MRDIRISIAVIVTMLISIGTVMIYSSSGVYALQQWGDSLHFLSRHLLFLLIGFFLAGMVMAIDYRDLRKIAKPLLLFAIFLLILVLIPEVGRASFGARRWFKIGPFSFQPSEFAKIVVLIYIADFLARKQNKMRNFWQGFLPPVLVLGCICGLVVKQPDLGNSILIGTIVIIMMFIAGARILHLGILVILSSPILYFAIVNVPYRLKRILVFLDPCRIVREWDFN